MNEDERVVARSYAQLRAAARRTVQTVQNCVDERR